MILIQAFRRREALFLLYRLYCRRLGASSSKAVEKREYSSSLATKGTGHSQTVRAQPKGKQLPCVTSIPFVDIFTMYSEPYER